MAPQVPKSNLHTNLDLTEISWLNWEDLNKNYEFFSFVRFLIHFRRAHACVRKYGDGGRLGLEECEVRCPDFSSKVLRVMYSGHDEEEDRDDAVCVMINVFWEKQWMDIPVLPEHYRWVIAVDTSERYLPHLFEGNEGSRCAVKDRSLEIEPRSVLVLHAVSESEFYK